MTIFIIWTKHRFIVRHMLSSTMFVRRITVSVCDDLYGYGAYMFRDRGSDTIIFGDERIVLIQLNDVFYNCTINSCVSEPFEYIEHTSLRNTDVHYIWS